MEGLAGLFAMMSVVLGFIYILFSPGPIFYLFLKLAIVATLIAFTINATFNKSGKSLAYAIAWAVITFFWIFRH